MEGCSRRGNGQNGQAMGEPIRNTSHPTAFQRKALWSAVTGLSMVLIGAVAVGLIWLFARTVAFLQPVLVPIAVAGIMAYLLNPLIVRLTRRGVKRTKAMLVIFTGFHLGIVLLVTLVVVPAVQQANRLVSDSANRARIAANLRVWWEDTATWIDNRVWSRLPVAQAAHPPVADAVDTAGAETATPDLSDERTKGPFVLWVEAHQDEWLISLRNYIWTNIDGALGVFGYLIGLLLVPVYLYYFLKEADVISRTWSDYLPLKESKFKSQLVATLTEINGYLIAFFRGQMLVSLIDGALVGLLLKLMGLPYGLLIGVFVALLGLLPYVGSLLCWVPAVLISIGHFGARDAAGHLIHTWSWLPQVWAYPLIVTGIFVIVQKVNSFVTTPRIVGESVGLHPLTVIFSVVFWSLLIGGFLGVLLAVPLTASVKVLVRRFVWEKRISPRVAAAG